MSSDFAQRGQRLLHIRKKLLRLSRKKFCEHFNWSTQSLKAWELGWGNGLSKERAKDLADHLKKLNVYTTATWIMHGIGLAPEKGKPTVNLLEEERIAKELLLFRANTGAIDAIVADSAMMPMLSVNDYVGGIVVKNPEDAIGHCCIVVDDKNNTHIRMLQKGDKADYCSLVGFNPENTSPFDIKRTSIKTLAPVVWIRKRMPAV